MYKHLYEAQTEASHLSVPASPNESVSNLSESHSEVWTPATSQTFSFSDPFINELPGLLGESSQSANRAEQFSANLDGNCRAKPKKKMPKRKSSDKAPAPAPKVEKIETEDNSPGTSHPFLLSILHHPLPTQKPTRTNADATTSPCVVLGKRKPNNWKKCAPTPRSSTKNSHASKRT